MSGQESESRKSREFDVIIWGASGFTGRLVLEYMHQTFGASGEVRWAVGGRNEPKLKQVLKEMVGADGEQIPVIIADSNDDASLRAMVGRTRSICTTVGPYAKYGTLLVGLCAELGTHYCDLTGEVPWMVKMIDQYHTVAEASGARIVHACGFDCIPSDLGTLFIQQAMKKRHGVYSPRVKYRVVSANGGMSGGTVASMMNMMEEAKVDPSMLDLMADPYALNPANMPRGEDGPDQTGPVYDQDFHQWTAPFIMAGVNTRVVRRSHALLDYPWAKNFRYDEAMLMGDGPRGFAKATLVSGGTGLMTLATGFAATRSVLARLAPSPGEGPSAETMANGFFEIEFFACHPEDPDKNLSAVVTADRDPGYGATSKMIAESAVCLAKDDLETPFGVLTPAVAMGEALIERLVARAGMTFTIQE